MLKRILRVELSDSYRVIDRYRVLLFHMVSCLSVCLPTHICDEFLRTQEKSCHLYFIKERERLDSKLRWLVNKKVKQSIVGIAPIQYSFDSGFNPVSSISGNTLAETSNVYLSPLLFLSICLFLIFYLFVFSIYVFNYMSL